jgi:hypothetical protein
MRCKALISLVFVFGCGGSEDPEPGVATTIDYDGTAEGTLIVAAFASVPPMGAPQGFVQENAPTFPATLMMTDLPAGTFHLLAMLDVAPSSPMQPGPEDLTVWSDPIEVAADAHIDVELTLVDP